ncbi:MAG: LysM peptidoglycan-binding domain-containing protein [Pseudomonadota bacterium]
MTSISKRLGPLVVLTVIFSGCSAPAIVRTQNPAPAQTINDAVESVPAGTLSKTDPKGEQFSESARASEDIISEDGPDRVTLQSAGGTDTVGGDAAQSGLPAADDESPTSAAPQKKTDETLLEEALDFCQAAQEFWQAGELDSALEALDQAYLLILDTDTGEDPKLFQQKEDIRLIISKRIMEIYASRHTVANGQHNAIPLDMNQHVEAEIKRFTTVERDFFMESYRRSGQYHEFIVASLKEAGFPEELAWLPLIESGFKVQALSRARALGLWQFIPSTGYKFGLKRETYVDERLDPYRSTAAAVSYLKELHQIFGDWMTALAAYNCGEGRVLRVIRSQNINYLDNFWDLYQRLPQETARYVPRFLATLHILRNPEKYGMSLPTPDPPMTFETVTIERQVSLRDISNALSVTEQSLRDLNPSLRYRILPKEPFDLRVSVGSGDELLAKLDTLPISSPPRPAYVYHKIRPGESLSTIARKYHTSVSRITQANNIRKSHFIVAGRTLKIPLSGTMVVTTAPPESSECPPGGQATIVHRVNRGDSLWIIAKRYDTTTLKIQQMNGLSGTHLSIGQKLNIPACSEKQSDTQGMRAYVVKTGDSPFGIAKQHNMSLNRFLSANGMTPRSTIYPGQTVNVE